MKWTSKNYLELAKKHENEFKKNFPTSDKPKSLFVKNKSNNIDYYIFSADNWNGYDPLREFVYENFEEKGKERDSITTKNNEVLEIFFSNSYDSKKCIFIFKNENESYQTIEVSWYKHRGRTERIYCNSNPIILMDYIYLLNLLNI